MVCVHKKIVQEQIGCRRGYVQLSTIFTLTLNVSPFLYRHILLIKFAK